MITRVVRLGLVSLLAVMALPLARASAAPAHPHTRSLQHAVAHAVVKSTGSDAIDAILDPMHVAPVGEVTRVPYGWADFCGRRPLECRVDVLDPTDVVMTSRVMRTLEIVNRQANASIEPVSNLDHWGTMLDHWDYPVDGKGDCKIYALWKRKLLLDAGFPRQALLMTIVRDLEGNGHTILTVKTDRGDLILDNMVGEIRLWDDTGYKFVKRQSQSDPNVWVSVGPTTMPVTTAQVN